MKTDSSQKNIFQKVVICGMGVMGASLGHTLVKEKLVRCVYGLIRRPEIAGRLVAEKLCHKASSDLKEAIEGAELIVLAIPASAVPVFLRNMLPFLQPGVIISDLCSVKQGVVKAAEATLKKSKAVYLSVHPMTGTEKFGFENYLPDLYRDTPCVITPGVKCPPPVIKKIKTLWESLGSRVLMLTPLEHDICAAWISHLPHVLSYLLFEGVEQQSRRRTNLYAMAAGSFRDMTRIAGSSAPLWADIFLHNKKELLKAVKLFSKGLASFQTLLEKGEEGPLLNRLSLISKAKKNIYIKGE